MAVTHEDFDANLCIVEDKVSDDMWISMNHGIRSII